MAPALARAFSRPRRRQGGEIVDAACTVTEARQQRFDFATPHFPVRMQLVERSPPKLQTPGIAESILRLKQSGIYYRIVEKYLGKRAVALLKESAP